MPVFGHVLWQVRMHQSQTTTDICQCVSWKKAEKVRFGDTSYLGIQSMY